ncbi:MAG: UDP-N-acetylmuramoyl-tripeptide--D-alanyl-D-alanine ligase [Candidatus Moraniibacteriota bacterium]|jgi:UDP-N-acetylmuramoyl-tripeptide--D-alanyl-D-alanine ligase
MIIRNLIYILQSELYDGNKFLQFAYSHFAWWKLEKRAHLVWTKKARLIYVLTALMLIVMFLLSVGIFGTWGVLSFGVMIPLVPIVIIAALWIIEPIDCFLKRQLFEKAQKFLRENRKNLTVVGITGSYGKTSTREILSSILSEKFRVIRLSENINTDIGIADFILKNPKIFLDNEIFIVEMGAYKRGEIKKLCELVEPDYAILTGINEAHLERFGSMENIIYAKFELPEASKKTVTLNFDDENVLKNYARFKLKDSQGVSKNDVKNVRVLDNFGGLEFEIDGATFRTKLLAQHSITLILMAYRVAQKLGMATSEISRGIGKIEYVPHRLEPIYNEMTKVWVIDDSYNGNYAGIVSGVEVLKRALGRKIVLTPGLVELGEKSVEVHEKIGRLYADLGVDLVLLIKSPNSGYITKGLKEKGFKEYRVYSSSQEAHADLSNVVKSGDAIIFQNDLPDNYF